MRQENVINFVAEATKRYRENAKVKFRPFAESDSPTLCSGFEFGGAEVTTLEFRRFKGRRSELTRFNIDCPRNSVFH